MMTEGTFYLVVAGWLVTVGGMGGLLFALRRRRRSALTARVATALAVA